MPLSLIPRNTVLRILQGPLAHRRWIVGSGVHGYWLGSYEFEKQRIFAQRASRASVVWDIGANVGFYTLIASYAMRADGTVYAFEPSPRNLRFLRRHIQLNDVRGVVVCPYAVSDRSGTAAFDESPGPSMGHIADAGSHTVRVAALDDLLASGDLRPPDLVKIDVEGEEARVLAGAAQTIETARPTILLATHSAELHRACSQWLRARGYRLAALGDDEMLAVHASREM